VDLCRRAVEHDEADSVVLGCAGMADFCHDVSEQVGVPVIDGVGAAVVLVESMVKLGLRTSTRSEYAPPLPKEYR
jgi:allantoin racemase